MLRAFRWKGLAWGALATKTNASQCPEWLHRLTCGYLCSQSGHMAHHNRHTASPLLSATAYLASPWLLGHTCLYLSALGAAEVYPPQNSPALPLSPLFSTSAVPADSGALP